jgi:hypothetical protein
MHPPAGLRPQVVLIVVCMMITRMTLLSVVLAFSAGCSHLQSDPVPPKLDFRVQRIDLEQDKFGNQIWVSFDADIRNVGQTSAVLPTKAIGPAVVGNAALVDILFADPSLQTTNGLRRAYSVAEIAPVELRPGEVTTLSYTFVKPAAAAARVTYRISRDFAARYRLWHGELTSGIIRLRE